jgi:hypothetical protein
MGGLLDVSLADSAQSAQGLGQSATNNARKAVADMRQRFETEKEIGSLVGQTAGNLATKKSAPAKEGELPSSGKVLGALAQNIFSGMLGNRQQIGQKEIDYAGASKMPSDNGAPFAMPTAGGLMSLDEGPSDYVTEKA